MTAEPSSDHPSPASWVAVVAAWITVGIPLLWGIGITFRKAAVLFQR